MAVLCFSLNKPSYIKEFVHGDFGRTKPNIGSLMNVTADILELDVEVNHFTVEMPICTLNSKLCFFGTKPNSTAYLKRCLKMIKISQ